MKIECPECHSIYRLDDSRIPDKGIHGRCSKCGNKIFIQKETDTEIILEDIPEQNPISDKCPECSQNRQPNETHCPNCGINYEKYQEYLEEKKIQEAEEAEKQPETEWEQRVLCSDNSCAGVIGSDGQCRVCGLPYTIVSEYPPPPLPTLTYKNPFVAVILSFIWAGLGQIYIGEYYKGRRVAFLYCISVLLLFFAVGFVTTPVLWFFGMYDAYTSAIRNNKRLEV